MDTKTKALLRKYAERFECAAFLEGDPSSFMHMAKGAANQEATAFVASSLSFGNRSQFMPKIAWIVGRARGNVDRWIRSGAFEKDFGSGDTRCFYRFFTHSSMHAFLSRYRAVMSEYGTLGSFVRENCGGDALAAVTALCKAFGGEGAGGVVPRDCTSACKRLCMFLRWMVRGPSPVDLGLWSWFVDRRTLVVPLDTHVLQEAARLGLVSGRASSMSAARRLTAKLAEAFPDDPARGDFALFGVGVAS